MKTHLTILTLIATFACGSAALAREDALPRGHDGLHDQKQKPAPRPPAVASPNRGKPAPAPATPHHGGADDAKPHH